MGQRKNLKATRRRQTQVGRDLKRRLRAIIPEVRQSRQIRHKLSRAGAEPVEIAGSVAETEESAVATEEIVEIVETGAVEKIVVVEVAVEIVGAVGRVGVRKRAVTVTDLVLVRVPRTRDTKVVD